MEEIVRWLREFVGQWNLNIEGCLRFFEEFTRFKVFVVVNQRSCSFMT
jgi:hypothetical protein